MIGAKKNRAFAYFVCLALAALIFAAPPAMAAKWYVDNALGEVKPEQKIIPAHPRPVQLLFEFQRDGSPNPKATKVVTPWALAALQGTGAFAEIVQTPTSDGALLSITFDNVVKKEELDAAKRQGFRAGLSFGLFGGVVVTDKYVVTLTYVPATGAAPIKTVIHHALHMKMGNKDVEIPGTEMKTADAAVQTIVRQALEHGVNAIVASPDFPQ